MQRHAAQPVKEIPADGAAFDVALDIAVRRGNHPHAHRPRMRVAEAHDLTGIEEPQEMGLRGERHFADLVEEEHTAIGRLRKKSSSNKRASSLGPPVLSQEANVGPLQMLSLASIRGCCSNGWCRRGLYPWMIWARISLPVPVSPVIRTVQLAFAIRIARAKTARVDGSTATMCSGKVGTPVSLSSMSDERHGATPVCSQVEESSATPVTLQTRNLLASRSRARLPRRREAGRLATAAGREGCCVASPPSGRSLHGLRRRERCGGRTSACRWA